MPSRAILLSTAGLRSHLLAAVFFTSSCSYFHPSAAEVSVPEEWYPISLKQTSAHLHSSEEIVSVFNDPILKDLWIKASSSNHDLQQQEALARKAAAKAGIDSSKLWPKVNLLFDNARQGGDSISTTGRYQLQGEISWEIDIWGTNRNLSDASEQEWKATWGDYQAKRLSLAGRLASEWYQYSHDISQWQVSKHYLENSQRTLEVVSWRYQRGIARSLELSLAKSEVAAANSSLLSRKEAILERKYHLYELLSDDSQELPNPQKLENLIVPQIPSGLPAEVIRRRPDIVAAELRYHAALNIWAASRKAYLPNLMLTGNAGNASDELRDLTQSGLFRWSLAQRILFPIFNAGAIASQNAQSEANQEQARYRYAEAVFNALLQVNKGLQHDYLLEKRLSATQQHWRESQRSASLARRDYRSGLTDITTLLDTQREALMAQSEFLEVQSQRLQQRINLIVALGGSFREVDISTASSKLASTSQFHWLGLK